MNIVHFTQTPGVATASFRKSKVLAVQLSVTGCKLYQGIHGLPKTTLQQKHHISPLKRNQKEGDANRAASLKKIASLERQLKHEELQAVLLDKPIDVAEKQVHISIRKKMGLNSPPSIKGKATMQSARHLPAVGFFCSSIHRKHEITLLQLSDERLIIEQIEAVRRHQPRCGGSKLYIMLQPFFQQHSIAIGRNNFFSLLRKNKLPVRKTKRNV